MYLKIKTLGLKLLILVVYPRFYLKSDPGNWVGYIMVLCRNPFPMQSSRDSSKNLGHTVLVLIDLTKRI